MAIRVIYGDGPLGDINSTATSLPAGYTLGEIRWNDTGTKKYRLFYNAGGASIPTGRVAAVANGGAGLYSVTVTTTTETGATFAVCCNDLTVTVPTASYFWGVVWGHPVQLLASNISVGTDIAVMCAANGVVMPATVPTLTPFAINKGDLAAGTTATAITDTIGTRFFVFFDQRDVMMAQAWA